MIGASRCGVSSFSSLFLCIFHEGPLLTCFFPFRLGYSRLCNPSSALRSTRGHLPRSTTEVSYDRSHDTTGRLSEYGLLDQRYFQWETVLCHDRHWEVRTTPSREIPTLNPSVPIFGYLLLSPTLSLKIIKSVYLTQVARPKVTATLDARSRSISLNPINSRRRRVRHTQFCWIFYRLAVLWWACFIFIFVFVIQLTFFSLRTRGK